SASVAASGRAGGLPKSSTAAKDYANKGGPMRSPTVITSGFSWGFVPRLAALYGALFLLPGIQMPFFPVWLKAKGMDAAMIGVVMATPMIIRAFSIPLLAHAVDRRDAVRATIMVASCVSVLGFVLLGLVEGVYAIFAVYVLA